MDGLRTSLREFGLLDDIIVNKRSGFIVGGHQRVKALLAEGETHAPVKIVDWDEVKEKRANLTLNNPHITGEFTDDAQALLRELSENNEELFTDLLLDRLLTDASEETVPSGIDNIPSAPKQTITKPSTLWKLGEHRLLCGDSTNGDNVKRLMGTEKPVCMWTDPPYGVSYKGKTDEELEIKNDDKEGLEKLLDRSFEIADTFLAEGAAIYIAHPAGAQSMVFGNSFLKRWRMHQTLVWLKHSMVLGHSDYHYIHEPIYFGYKSGGGRRGRGGAGWYGDDSQTSVFVIPRPIASEEHPTMKPVQLVLRMILNSSPPKGLVFDPFLGSGTTLIASEHAGRRCFGMEYDPKYCDVIVKRWQDLTGQKAHVEAV